MMIVGLTGGIGSGKSYVAAVMERRGIPVYRTDDAARRLMTASLPLRSALIRLVGRDAYLSDGSLNKPVVGRFIFGDAGRRMAVNAVVHQAVREDFLSWVEGQTASVTVMECAILFEAGFDTLVDRIVEVTAPVNVRIRRVQQRDGLTEAQVRDRMAAQLSDEERCARVHYIICNDGVSDVEEAVSGLLASLLSLARHEKNK